MIAALRYCAFGLAASVVCFISMIDPPMSYLFGAFYAGFLFGVTLSLLAELGDKFWNFVFKSKEQ